MVSFDRCEASVLLPYPIAGIVAIEWTESHAPRYSTSCSNNIPVTWNGFEEVKNGFLVMSAQTVSVKPPSAHEK